MHKAIFVAACLLLGWASVVKCYSYGYGNDVEAPLNRREADSAASNEWSELYQRLFEASDESDDVSEEETRQFSNGDAKCSGCKSGQLCYVQNKCSCPVGPTTSPCEQQKAGLCTAAATKNSAPAVSLEFGSGTGRYNKAKPEEVGFSTKYKQVVDDSVSVEDGYFAFVNSIPPGHSAWHTGAGDHTSSDKTGYMMLVNAAYGAGTVLQITVKDLTVGLRYQLSAYFANVVKKGTNILQPDLLIEARTTDGILIASTPTGKIPEESTMTWKQYGMSFVTPSSTIILSLKSNTGGGGGDDFAMDDVKLVACASIIDNAACGGK